MFTLFTAMCASGAPTSSKFLHVKACQGMRLHAASLRGQGMAGARTQVVPCKKRNDAYGYALLIFL